MSDFSPRPSGVEGSRSGSEPVLDVAGLDVAFVGVGAVLRDVGLRLEPGRCLAVVGESGAGKSVLARTLVGLAGEGGAPATVTARRLSVAGQDVRSAGTRQWRRLRGDRVGFVLQDALQSLDPLRTVGAEVAESLRVRGVGRVERQRRALEALELAGLDSPATRAAQRSGELSGGMRQRALIASAIVANPSLLIADEPTTALDATVASGVLDLLGRLRDEGTALLLVSHDLAAVARLADDVLVLDGGRVVEHGPASEVLHRPQHEVTQALLNAVPHGPRPTHRRTPHPPSADSSIPAGTAREPSTAPAARESEPILRATGLHRRYRLPGGGSVAALEDVDLVVEGDGLPPSGEVDRVVRSIVRESLTNVVRHARARSCRIELRSSGAEICVSVEDNGLGMATDRWGVGLTAMRERVSELGGHFVLSPGSADGSGTVVSARLPVPGTVVSAGRTVPRTVVDARPFSYLAPSEELK